MRSGTAGATKAQGGGGLAPTETVALNAGTLATGVLVGASLVSAMGDHSDLTYVESVTSGSGTSSSPFTSGYRINSAGFADMVGAGGVSAFRLNVRVADIGATSDNGVVGEGFTGISGVSPAGLASALPSSTITDRTIGLYTKSGGGVWTPAQINALVCTISLSYSFAAAVTRLYELSLTVNP